MDTQVVLSGEPRALAFSKEEIASFFEDKDFSRRFHLGRLRRRQLEKALQVILLDCHDILVKDPEEVHRYVTHTNLSIVKARRAHWGYYVLTVWYTYQGTAWEHVFRFERNTGGGLSGILYFNSRRPKVAK